MDRDNHETSDSHIAEGGVGSMVLGRKNSRLEVHQSVTAPGLLT